MEKHELTVGDVTRMALEMEQKGMEFYNWAAGKFGEPDVVAMFQRLAAEEKEHIRIFEILIASSDTREVITQDNVKYLRMLAESQDLFPNQSSFSSDIIKSAKDALAIGIQTEKDAILFYQELYNQTNSDSVKNVLSKLLEAEKMHLVELRENMDELR